MSTFGSSATTGSRLRAAFGFSSAAALTPSPAWLEPVNRHDVRSGTKSSFGRSADARPGVGRTALRGKRMQACSLAALLR
jgi:hypothetical protein